MKKAIIFTAIAALGAFIAGCATTGGLANPETVKKVDLSKYLGAWYDVAHLPFSYQADCYNTTATYGLLPNGDISVENKCRLKSFDGEEKKAVGRAWVVDKTSNAKLKVQFFWPFRGDYWILELDDEYKWALVGSPNHYYLWILSREPSLEPAVYDEIVKKAKLKGYDVSRLIKTPQRKK